MSEENKKSGKLDKLIMGVILGGAIGSVLGLTFAPRKGKETREIIKNKGKEFIRDHKEALASAKYQIKKGKGFFRWLFRKKTSEEQMPRASMEEYDNRNE